MNALVTGGGGFLGRYLVEQLIDRGDRVRVLCRGNYPELTALGIELVQGDLRDAQLVKNACAGIDAVFHVAAVPGIWGAWDMFHSINTLGTENVIQACHAQRVSKLIYTSSPSVIYDGKPHINADESLPYPDHYLCHYPHSKALGEKAVLNHHNVEGLSTVALRPHLIWGPRDNHLIPRLVKRAQAGRLLRVGDGTNLVSMSYVENVAAAHLQAADALQNGADRGGKAYFINEEQPVNLWNWINELLELGNLPPVRRSVSPTFAYTIGSVLEGVYKTLRIQKEPPMTRFLASQLSQSHTYSITRAQHDFSYHPLVSVDAGMQRIAPEIRSLVKNANT